jgi:riboflavin synthase
MFTGLISDLGTVEAVEASSAGARLRVATSLAGDLAAGDSIAVDGVCLTVASADGSVFAADVMNQTLSVTSLGGLEAGGRVNLEPALRAGDALGGHLVQGHVDGLGTVAEVTADGFARRIGVTLPIELRRYVAEHGSVALDGVSLTVAQLTPEGLEVSLIPETLERTTLGSAQIGGELNVEVDLIARYAERLLEAFEERSGVRDA